MVSVIAPAYNNPEEVKMLLASITSSRDVTFPFEVIIVDDGSHDHSIEEVAGRYGFARYIRMDKNCGAAAARNSGARESRYDALFFVDSDVMVLPDTLARAARYFRDPEIRAFVGRLSTVPVNEGFFPRYKAIMFNSWLPTEDYSTVFSPAVGGVRKNIFFESGGFDETIRGATVEYVKFSYELRKRCVIDFCPDVVVKVTIKSLAKALYTDFYSTMKWVTIFSRYRKFDNHCTSISGGLGRLAGSILAVSFPLCMIYGFYLAWLLMLTVYVCLNRRFFGLVISQTRSFNFLSKAIITHLILSIVTAAGAACGAVVVITGSFFRIGRGRS